MSDRCDGVYLFGQKLYFSPALNLLDSEIIAYTFQSRPMFVLVSTIPEQVFERLDSEEKLILHSNQGLHYQMAQCQKTLANPLSKVYPVRKLPRQHRH